MPFIVHCALLALSIAIASAAGNEHARTTVRHEQIGDQKIRAAGAVIDANVDELTALELLDWADDTVVANSRTTNINLKIVSMGQSCVKAAPGATIRYFVIGELSDDYNEGLALIGFDLHFEGGPLQQADEPSGEPTDGCENPMIHFDRPWGITNPAGFGGTPINGDLIQCGGGQNTINNTSDNADFPIGPVLTGVARPSGCGPAAILTGLLTVPAAEGTYRLSISNVFANVIKEGETGQVFWATESAGAGLVRGLTVIVGRGFCLPTRLAPQPSDK